MKLQRILLLLVVLLFCTVQMVLADEIVGAVTAVYQDDIDAVKLLLDGGLDPNLTGVENYQASLLNTACSNNSIEMVRLLLANGADVNLKGYGNYTPLMWAAESAATTELLELLLAEGADIDPIALDGVNALIKSVFGVLSDSGSFEAVKLLIDQGMDVNYAIEADSASGYTALMFAIRWGKIDVVRFLISAGADVSVKTDDNTSPLSIAAEEGYTEITELLKEFGATE